MFGNVLRIGFVLFFSVNVFAGKIDKAYEALKIYDYFKAKSLFLEELEDEPVAARYGLTIIYYRSDNPFHNLDTSYVYIQKVEVDFNNLSNKKQKKLLKFSIDEEQITKLHSDIVLAFWNKVKDTDRVKTLNLFIKTFPDFKDIEEVKQIRTDLAYDHAVERNTFQSYSGFFTTYPHDIRAEEAKVIYEKKLYEAKTEKGVLQSYIDFIYIYPENPYVGEAEDTVFALSTKNKTAKSYKWYVDNFPESPHASEAWSNLFVLSFTDFNDAEIRKFIQENHDFPFPKDFSEARVLRDLELYKITKNWKWGFVDAKGVVKIKPKYEFENDFSNELALVANEDFVGYINKKGEQVIDFIYDDGGDFIEGVAVVSKGDNMALINKLGNRVLDLDYSYISEAKDGVVLARRNNDGKYIYFSVLGDKLFGGKEFEYAEAYNGYFAIVGDGKHFGVIDINGNVVLDVDNLKIIRDVRSRFRVKNIHAKFGLISISDQDTIIPFKFDDIGRYSEGKYAVFLDDKYGFYREDGSISTKLVHKRFDGDVDEAIYKNGFTLTKTRNKYGIVDSIGGKVFPNIFEEIGDVVDYPVPCKKRGKWGYVTKRITMWLPYKYTYAGAFEKGQAIVSKGGKYGVINKKKKIAIPFKYNKISSFHESYYLAVLKDKYGVIDRKGKVIVPFYYSNIKEFKGDVLVLDYKGEVYYYNVKSKVFIYGSFPK